MDFVEAARREDAENPGGPTSNRTCSSSDWPSKKPDGRVTHLIERVIATETSHLNVNK